MRPDEIGHAAAVHLVRAEDLCHLCVGGEVVLVVGVLQFVIPDVGPEEVHDLGAGSFRLADDVSELGAELLLGWGAP